MCAYSSLEMLRAYIGTTKVGDDDLLQNALDAAQQKIDRECGRAFEPSTGTRYYREDSLVNLKGLGGSGNVLYLGKDLLALGGLTNGDGTTIASTDCWLEPRNTTGAYQWIRLKSNESWSWGTDGEIEVSGTWGYSTAAPDDIAEATRELAAYYYRLKSNQITGVIANPETGSMTVLPGVPASVKKILYDGGYIRRRVIV